MSLQHCVLEMFARERPKTKPVSSDVMATAFFSPRKYKMYKAFPSHSPPLSASRCPFSQPDPGHRRCASMLLSLAGLPTAVHWAVQICLP
ncbi:hypothetical protein BJX61DRAFT_451828 [Aspergillus egyptiacus]|nr:hypothetical protein BJX61DRAFT_451828 [Aspergillus egyptiacus]